MRTARRQLSSPSMIPLVLLVAALATLWSASIDAFVVTSNPSLVSLVSLQAKKKSSKAKGFGKVETPTKPPAAASTAPPASTPPGAPPVTATSTEQRSAPAEPKPFLQSVESSSSDDADPEERAKALLRDKYGMKTLEEQQLDAKQLEARKEQQKKLKEWTKKAEAGEDFDVMSMLPAPVLIAIDRFLKLGTALCTVAFVSAGVLITVEAWSKASNSPLPDNIDAFITNTVEPNFTPGLFVLLGFSVSLGVFAALQMGSQGSTYRED